MVDQLPNAGREHEMLEAMGMSSMDDLFSNIPVGIRRAEPLPLPDPQSEEEIWADAQRILGSNVSLDDRPSFLSAGLSRNFVPSVVGMLATRGEFLTSYTPYQPEVSQGMLQAMWEFQTMICELVDLPISNVSMYDASTSAAEAITCAVRVNNRKALQKDIVYISSLVPPHRMSVIRNYTIGAGIEIRTIEHDDSGNLLLSSAESATGSCAVYVEQPNSLGIVDIGLTELKSIIGDETSLIVGIDAVSLGVLEPPGKWGADMVVGEGQPFGIGPTFGGPIYGIFACSEKYLRQMPGRVVGQSWDTEGSLAFTLTLSTREQHIRRAKATSNICTNTALCALATCIHLSSLGRQGIRELALQNLSKATYARARLAEVSGIEFPFDAPCFNEFVVRLPVPAGDVVDACAANGVVPGVPLGRFDEVRENELLVCVTEIHTRDDIERLAKVLAEACS